MNQLVSGQIDLAADHGLIGDIFVSEEEALAWLREE